MKKISIVCLLLCACNPKVSKKNLKKEAVKMYEIICKHPLGHIENFKVDETNFRRPSNHRGGIWSFETIDGYYIRSSNCHTDSRSIQIK